MDIGITAVWAMGMDQQLLQRPKISADYPGRGGRDHEAYFKNEFQTLACNAFLAISLF